MLGGLTKPREGVYLYPELRNGTEREKMNATELAKFRKANGYFPGSKEQKAYQRKAVAEYLKRANKS